MGPNNNNNNSNNNNNNNRNRHNNNNNNNSDLANFLPTILETLERCTNRRRRKRAVTWTW